MPQRYRIMMTAADIGMSMISIMTFVARAREP